VSVTEGENAGIPVRTADRSRRRPLGELPAGLTWPARIASYDAKSGFPHSLFIAADGRVVGSWLLGQDYRNKARYYGEYPPNYLRRVKALFPDKQRVLHLFSGKVDTNAFPGDTVDINPDLNPTYVDDAQRLERVPLYRYDLVLVDPAYTDEDSAHYGTTPIKRNLVMRALQRTSPGCHVVWLDMALAMWRRDYFTLEACIGCLRSSNHRFRMICIWQRTDFR